MRKRLLSSAKGESGLCGMFSVFVMERIGSAPGRLGVPVQTQAMSARKYAFRQLTLVSLGLS